MLKQHRRQDIGALEDGLPANVRPLNMTDESLGWHYIHDRIERASYSKLLCIHLYGLCTFEWVFQS